MKPHFRAVPFLISLLGFADASNLKAEASTPTNVVANAYNTPTLRSECFTLATNGVIGGTDATTFDTTPGTGFPYQFAGLLYLENVGSGQATRFDVVSIDLTTSADFSDTPRLYVLRHNSDPASSNPALDDRYARMPVVPVRTASNSAGQPAYTFDLTSLSSEERTGYGFAVVGAGMYLGTSISISELSATTQRVADTAVITPQPFLVAGPNGHRYGLSVVRGDWEQSEASAVAAGSHLVTINDAVENAFLVPQFGGTERFYIGLKQDGPGATTEPGGGWRWRTGELLSTPGAYLNWHSTQPNGSEGPTEDFGFMNEWQPSGTWGDAVVGGYPPALRNTFRGIIELDTAGTEPKTFFLPEISAKSNIFDAGLAAPTQGGSLPPSIDVTHANQQFVVFPQIVGVIDTSADKHGPDGKHTAGRSCDLTSVGGISGYLNGNNTPALVGVFLGPTLPVSAPPRLDFSTGALGEDFTTLAPALGQVFFIGDGFTSAGVAQKFTVPAGATRLYFGVPDGNSGPTNDNATLYHGTPRAYGDNTGSISLRATITPGPIPTIVDAFFPLRGGQLTFLGGTGASTVAVQSGALPTWMFISTSGLVSGVPTDGPYSFTLRVTDSLGEQSDHVFSGNIGPVLSTFDSDVDGWTASGDPADPPQFFATGGNPAGRIRVTDGSQGSYMGFDAPTKFLGNQSEKYGGTLHFDLMQSYSGAASQADEPDVTLVSGLLTLVYDTTPNPANNAWTSYSVPLTETAGWKVGSLTGPAPTQAQMQSVLGNLSALRIRAEFQNGPDTDSLDNARLVAPMSVSEIAVEHPVGTALTDGSGSVLFGSSNLGTPIVKTFTISNSATATGNLNLTGTKPTVDGTHGSDFVTGDYGSTALAPGASTTVTVTFTPTATGTRTAELHIISNDSDETSFDILVEGAGSVPIGGEAVSTFDTDTDGWTAVGDIATNALFSATGGNPGGHIYVIDAATNGITRFNAPAKFLGNQSGKYGGTLSFDLSQTYPGAAAQINETDIVLVGNGLTLVYDTSPNPAKDAWTSYSISLTETAGWKIGSLTGSAPSHAQMQGVLGSLTSLLIRSEYQTGADTGSLDNVRLVELASLPEIAVEQPVGTALTDGSGSVLFGSSNLGTPIVKTFTISNSATATGNLNLTGTKPTVDGTHGGEFVAGDYGSTSLAPGASTTVTVTFTPTATGTRTAELHIISNDSDETSFDILVEGVGSVPIGVEVVSTFDTDTDGWTAVGDIATNALFSATGGNPGGHIYVTDAATGGITRFNAPAKFLGNQSGKYGGTLSFDLSQTYPGVADQIDETDVILVGNGMTLVYDTSPNPAKDAWTSYSISLTETAGWKIDSLTGSAPSQAQMQAVLGNLTSLRIRSEFQNEADTGSLDNVRLVEPVSLPEIAVERDPNQNLTDNMGFVDFGAALPPVGNTVRTFTIRNSGSAPLSGLVVTKNGTHPDDFVFSALSSSTVNPGDTATFSVIFTPLSAGAKNAAIHIQSNDADENTFDIALIGTGGIPITDWRQTHFSTTANAGDAADDTDPDFDGASNLLEFATNTDPTVSSITKTLVTAPADGFITFTYIRNKQAMAELTYQVQWTDDLLTAWSVAGVSETIISDNGLAQTVLATLPAGASGQRFVHLRVSR